MVGAMMAAATHGAGFSAVRETCRFGRDRRLRGSQRPFVPVSLCSASHVPEIPLQLLQLECLLPPGSTKSSGGSGREGERERERDLQNGLHLSNGQNRSACVTVCRLNSFLRQLHDFYLFRIELIEVQDAKAEGLRARASGRTPKMPGSILINEMAIDRPPQSAQERNFFTKTKSLVVLGHQKPWYCPSDNVRKISKVYDSPKFDARSTQKHGRAKAQDLSLSTARNDLKKSQ